MHQPLGRQIEPARLPGRIPAGNRASSELLDVSLSQRAGRQGVKNATSASWLAADVPSCARVTVKVLPCTSVTSMISLAM